MKNPLNNNNLTKGQRSVIKLLWLLLVLGIAAVAVFFVMVYNGAIGYMPPVEELKNPNDRFASVIYSADGQELGRYFRNTGNRVYADYDEISQHVVDALIATEDSRFEDHSGIDMRALARVAFKTVLLGNRNSGGGSTITQQLAKQLYSPESTGFASRVMQKPIEWMIAVKLERFYSKDEILKMYLNQFDFLYNAVGIKSAAYVYFGKQSEELSIEEAATLVGMVKNPSYYNPVRQPERTRQRRNIVLEQMYKNDKITKEQLDSLKELPLTLDFHKVDHKEGPAPYFREELRRMLRAKRPALADYREWDYQKYVEDSIAWANNPLFGWIEKNTKPDGSKYDIYTDGLRIYTTKNATLRRRSSSRPHEQNTAACFLPRKTQQQARPLLHKQRRGDRVADKLNDKPLHTPDRPLPRHEKSRKKRPGDTDSIHNARRDESVLILRSCRHRDDSPRLAAVHQALPAHRLHGNGPGNRTCKGICGRTQLHPLPVRHGKHRTQTDRFHGKTVSVHIRNGRRLHPVRRIS